MPSRNHSRPAALGLAGAVWGIIGVLGMLLWAIYRLTPVALEAYRVPLPAWTWGLVLVVSLLMAYAEGYRGFQLRFSPRTAARIRHLRHHPDGLNSLLAPVFAFGYFRADRRTRITAYTLSSGILALVLIVHRLQQPWRGIIDTGVVIGLIWGVLSLIVCIYRALSGGAFEHSPALPPSPARDVSESRGDTWDSDVP